MADDGHVAQIEQPTVTAEATHDGEPDNQPTPTSVRLRKLGEQRAVFLLIALVFHVVYALSIFDIYFVSPVVNGMSGQLIPGPAPADRLVLIVGDGLRADKTFMPLRDPDDQTDFSERPLMPFIRSRALEVGTFGVSHTRVPTESRPGHVALIAGLYEDVSAVTTGWQLNPVHFDSLFNQSRHTWSWGSPDILPMFQHGASPGRVDTVTYGAEAEDFTSSDSSKLDTWVFERVFKMFDVDALEDPDLECDLRKDKNVFFLHLLGLDTAGHSYRPYSDEYYRNIKVVDAGVKKMVDLFDWFYGDNRTAFVFTADHGMSDWGSHGDGHPDNTRTPLVAWGSGVAGPSKTDGGTAAGHEDGFLAGSGFDQVARHDVEQADIATLMAHLIGVPFPVNSVGKLPIPYLAGDDEAKASALLANARQMLEMYLAKESQKRTSRIGFVSFGGFARPDESVAERLAQIERLIADNEHQDAISQTQALIETTLAGLQYLQRYDWLFLRSICTLGYVGWVLYALLTALDLHLLDVQFGPAVKSSGNEGVGVDKVVAGSVVTVLFGYLAGQSSPLSYYAYAVFPIMYWHKIFTMRHVAVKSVGLLFSSLGTSSRVARTVICVVGLELLVWSYFERRLYTVLYLVAAIWPIQTTPSIATTDPKLYFRWVGACVCMSVFTLLPAIKQESLGLIQLGGLLFLLTGIAHLASQPAITGTDSTVRRLELARRCLVSGQVGLIALAMITTWSSVRSIQARTGLPFGAQVVGWITIVGSVVVLPVAKLAIGWLGRRTAPVPVAVPAITLHQPTPKTATGTRNAGGAGQTEPKIDLAAEAALEEVTDKLTESFLTFGPSFIVLTISYEGLFFQTFFALLVTWIDIERRIVPPSSGRPGQPRPLSLNEFRIAFFFLFLIQSAFFSTGNLASVSSFSLDAVNRLIPVFDPFSQGGLLLFKLLAPFVVLSGAVGLVNSAVGVNRSTIFMVVAGLTDVLALNFFWLVKDEGSWLDIGTSISHFVIAQLLGLFVIGLGALSELVA